MKDIGKKIAYLREKNKMTQVELAKKLGIATQSIVNYETGKRLIPLDVLEKTAIYFGIPIEKFFNVNDDDFKNIESSVSEFKKIPIISRVSAGRGEWANEEILDWLELPVSICKNADFATFIKGDSMEPRIKDGEIILVKQDICLDTGDIGVFRIGDEVFCKKFYYNPIIGESMLKSINTKYDPIYVDKEDWEKYKCLGKVLCSIDYNF